MANDGADFFGKYQKGEWEYKQKWGILSLVVCAVGFISYQFTDGVSIIIAVLIVFLIYRQTSKKYPPNKLGGFIG